MSHLYGFLAGLFVCASVWGAMTYISDQAGLLVGVFLVIFITVTTVYIHGDEVNEHQKGIIRSLTDMEIIFFDKLKMIERKIDYLEDHVTKTSLPTAQSASNSKEIDDMIGMIEQILGNQEAEEKVREAKAQGPLVE
jgi:hypothetical protein